METRKLVSSNMNMASHDGRDMFIRFNSGSTYKYESVPYLVFDQMCTAESVGKYFHQFVKGTYVYSKGLENE